MRDEQFVRTIRLIGPEAVEKLHHKSVTFVGLGAVGGYALEGLVRLGIGSVCLIDFDKVEPSNLNRQLLATWPDMGKNKVEIAAARVKAINPDCVVQAFPMYLTPENASEVVSQAGDLLVDAIDSVKSKCALLEAAYLAQKPVVSSMGAALRRNPTLVRTADLMDTTVCPLARTVRQELRKRGVGRGISVVYSPEPVSFTYHPEEGKVLGSLPTVTGIFGLNLAHLAMLRLLRVEKLPVQTN
ncbi:MAG: tRNA threonylcarbamoyladenosine dehydratase [Sphaerochaeta sp.]|jgi:tRNA A37 threonylcarbamoyladenosine dehydratase|nr:tRNA threonylcarbamoyladenosine dehydratase [Sphaerochaeta sp.]MCH3920395.1 tRNA threonylcarbamoyladenosine dehydratase [Sphaerochaeta sp.]MCI2044959.1 tRNA threonylcarbamoyladenosine dehydratase [Sphaerochaeta sp.]MCI2076298.1 tRNA threonylcarbamoyladenosine dehydratase [Sphaerochaeta sp.]MCI2096542.1 tRNA threonylcarbamoyladenosine dehydratase [Sphaerochaeta sp.]